MYEKHTNCKSAITASDSLTFLAKLSIMKANLMDKQKVNINHRLKWLFHGQIKIKQRSQESKEDFTEDKKQIVSKE